MTTVHWLKATGACSGAWASRGVLEWGPGFGLDIANGQGVLPRRFTATVNPRTRPAVVPSSDSINQPTNARPPRATFVNVYHRPLPRIMVGAAEDSYLAFDDDDDDDDDNIKEEEEEEEE